MHILSSQTTVYSSVFNLEHARINWHLNVFTVLRLISQLQLFVVLFLFLSSIRTAIHPFVCFSPFLVSILGCMLFGFWVHLNPRRSHREIKSVRAFLWSDSEPWRKDRKCRQKIWPAALLSAPASVSVHNKRKSESDKQSFSNRCTLVEWGCFAAWQLSVCTVKQTQLFALSLTSTSVCFCLPADLQCFILYCQVRSHLSCSKVCAQRFFTRVHLFGRQEIQLSEQKNH